MDFGHFVDARHFHCLFKLFGHDVYHSFHPLISLDKTVHQWPTYKDVVGT
jgi:hypothetical protein